jgi:hypothetical protein
MQFFIHCTPAEIRLVTVSDIAEGMVNAQMKGFRIQTGTLKTWEKDEKMPAAFPDRLLKGGYIAIPEAQYQEYLKTAGAELFLQAQEPQSKDYDIVPWETIGTQFAPPFLNDVNEYLSNPVFSNFCLYHGDTVIDGDMVIDFSELSTNAQTATRNIVVNGNLTIKGNFDASRNIEALPQFVYVRGNLNAHHLILSGWLDMIVEGDATITGTVMGYYGEPGGRLLIKGDLKTGHLLNGFMYLIKVEGNTSGACYSFDTDGLNAQQIKSSLTSKNEFVNYPLREEVIPYNTDLKEYSFSFEDACTLLRKGETIFVS